VRHRLSGGCCCLNAVLRGGPAAGNARPTGLRVDGAPTPPAAAAVAAPLVPAPHLEVDDAGAAAPAVKELTVQELTQRLADAHRTAAERELAHAKAVKRLERRLRKVERTLRSTGGGIQKKCKAYKDRARASKYMLQESVYEALGGDDCSARLFCRDFSARFAGEPADMLDGDEALAMMLDTRLTQDGYQCLRNIMPAVVPARAAYEKAKQKHAIKLKEVIYDGKNVGYAVADPVQHLLVPHLVAFLRRNPTEVARQRAGGSPLVVQYKYGSDSFSIERFEGGLYNCEQTLLTLLLPDRSANSWRHSCPLAFVMHHKETPELLKSINDAVDVLLPRGANRFVRCTLPGDDFQFQFELVDFRCGDAKAVAAEYGCQGVHAFMNCMLCDERHGPHGACLFERSVGRTRTLAELNKWGGFVAPLNEWHAANARHANVKAKSVKPDEVAARQSWVTLVKQQADANPEFADALSNPVTSYVDALDITKLGNRTVSAHPAVVVLGFA
jgi:hypothetical protein